MKTYISYTFAIFSLWVLMIVSCKEATQQPISAASNEPTNLNTIETILPEAPGYKAFQMNCISCHSARYVQMQPDLPEKTWTAIVAKMQKNFGVPLADSSAREIVQYLTAIKGKK
jgi:cytochrome c5